jgi:RHS repeat-associated protein
LGHTRLLLDGNGNAVNRYAYDAWGNLIDYEENVPNPFTWNGAYGYEWIPLTGLYHVGAREYDPRTARWLQRDPIEASSGDPNFWRYCGNDPLNGVDPSGLIPFFFEVTLETDPETGLIYRKPGREIGEGKALERRIRGDDVFVKDDSLKKARRAAKDLEKKVARELGGKVVGPEIHPTNIKAVAPAHHFHTELSDGTRHRGHNFFAARGQSRFRGSLRGGARVFGIFGLGLGMLNIANAATDPCGKLGEAVGGELGSLIGAGIGAAIGSAILPGAGTIAGGFIGGLVGGKAGEWIGGWFD